MLVGGTPIDRTGGNPMTASSAATTMSQCRARSVPPARQLPCTWAITGMVQSQTRAHPAPRSSIASTSPSRPGRGAGSAGSMSSGRIPYPEEKERPEPRITMARVS